MRKVPAFLSLFLAGAAAADTAAVRSGEHGPFTRVVIDLPVGADWTLAGADERLEVRYTRPDVDFDIAEAFARIDRSRIGGMRDAGSGTLEIDLACACGVSSFEFGGDMLVLDIGPLSERYRMPDAAAEETGPVAIPLAGVSLGDLPSIGPRSRVEPDAIAFDPDRGRVELPGVDDVVSDIRGSVLQSAAAGMLTPAVTLPDSNIAKPAEQTGQGTRSQPRTVSRHTTDDGVRIGLETCTPDDRLLQARSEAGSSAASSGSQPNLYSEVDALVPEAVARRRIELLSSALGAEARALDRLAPGLARPELTALSYLVDAETDPTGFFDGQLSCDGQAGLWAVLSQKAPRGSGSLDTLALLRNYDALPPEVRRTVGKRLAESLADMGQAEAAHEVLLRLDRAFGGGRPDLAVARAAVSLDEGRVEEAAERLETAAPQTQADVPSLAMARIDTAFARNETVAATTMAVIEDYLGERRATDEGPALWHARIRGLLSGKDFDAAVATFLAVPPQASDAQKDAARRDLVDRMVANAGAVSFLKVMVSPDAEAVHPRDRLRIRMVAERLLKLGAPEAALAHLDRLPAQPADEDRLLRAEAQERLGLIAEAERTMFGLTGRRADAMRARLREQMGDFEAAGEVYARLGDDGAARRTAWLQGDWAGLAGEGDSFEAAATLAVETAADTVIDPSTVTLEAAGALVGSSAAARDALAALLADTALE